jgi:hypothetical protein
MIRKSAPTYKFEIYIGGDYNQALVSLQRYTERGACVSCQPVDYVYKFGREAGICVTLINYPRFPRTKEALAVEANVIARQLMLDLAQGSYSIVGPDETVFVSRRDEDKE